MVRAFLNLRTFQFTCSDGCFKMPLNEVFTDVNWCDARNATMRVDIKVTNEVDQVTSHDNYVVPSIGWYNYLKRLARIND